MVALTLAPAMASKLLKAKRLRKTTRWSSASTPCSASCAAPTWRCCCAICATRSWLRWFLRPARRHRLALPQRHPGIHPREDRGAFFVVVSGPEGSSYRVHRRVHGGNRAAPAAPPEERRIQPPAGACAARLRETSKTSMTASSSSSPRRLGQSPAGRHDHERSAGTSLRCPASVPSR